MIRGTTAKFQFKLPYAFSYITSLNGGIQVVFWQDETHILIQKDITHCSCADSEHHPNDICVSLCPTETLMFSDEYKAKAQLKGTLGPNEDDDAFASREYLITVDPIYKGCDIDDWEIVNPASREVIFDAGIVSQAGDD